MPIKEIVSNIFNKKFSLLALFVSEFIIERKPFDIVVFVSGDAAMYQPNLVDQEIQVLLDTNSYIRIPFVKILQQILADVRYHDFLSRAMILNKSEKQILELIRRGDAKKITVHFKEGKPLSVETEKRENIFLQTRLSEVFLKRGYESITITTDDGNIQFATRTTKLKL